MKKYYDTPELKLISVSSEDVITTSYTGDDVRVGTNGKEISLPNVSF